VTVAAPAVVVALVVAHAIAFPRGVPPTITEDNANRIRVGMSRAEVLATLGPPGDYRSGQTNWTVNEESVRLRGHTYDAWQTDWCIIGVEYDSEKRVVEQPAGWPTYQSACRVEQSRLGNLLWRLKRPWQRWFPE
jgi:hypothetical protein